MLKFLGILIVALLAVVGVMIVTAPDEFRVERTAHISAPPEKVFALVEDFHHWNAWSPWEKLDPTLKRGFEGAEHGKGAVYTWQGNDQVGQGRMEILEAFSPSKVTIKLDFLKPFESHNTAEFNIAAVGDGTDITWSMHGPNNLVSKAMHLFFNMDKLVGKDFDNGLKNMKAVAEK
ncbi:MAG: SRPBCC family protein [Deltaproteobacteria bacterium]|nr:SRPBCC family protein [Deltaproteobacteria bacterium]